jgi:hypothetical protein
MLNLDPKYKPILLDALEDMMYKISLQLEDLKGEPMGKRRKKLTEKQALVEELQQIICANNI